MTTNDIHGEKYYGICAECLSWNFDSQGFVVAVAGIAGSYRGIAWELTSHHNSQETMWHTVLKDKIEVV